MPADPLAWLAYQVAKHVPGLVRPVLWVPLFTVLVFAIVTLAVRTGLPTLASALAWAAQRVVDLLVPAVLLVQVAFAAPFRAVRRRPPALVYAVGDSIIPVVNGTRSRLAGAPRQARRLATGFGLPMLLTLALVGWWNKSDCLPGAGTDRQPCQHPVQQWVHDVSDLLRRTF